MTDSECNESLADVNKSWSSKRVVITTSKITVGISFDLPHFHSVVLARSPNCLPRNLIQTSCRVRQLHTNMVYVFDFHGKPQRFIMDNLMNQRSLHFDTYAQLLRDVSFEYQNKGVDVLKLFVERVGYSGTPSGIPLT